MGRCKDVLSVIVASILSYFITMLVYFNVSTINLPARGTMALLIAFLVSYGVSYALLSLIKVENPSKKAFISALIGSSAFWASCVALLLALAPALSNM
jgi:hypothetical protein